MKHQKQMKKIRGRYLRSLAAAAGLTLAATASQAAMITLSPSGSIFASYNNTVTFDIVADFAEFGTLGVLGGGIDISWDSSVLSSPVTAYTFAGRDASLDSTVANTPGGLTFGIANFSGMTIGAGTILGTLAFTVTGTPGSSSALTLIDSDPNNYDAWYSASSNSIPVSYTGATVSVAAVPLPAAAWLFMSGITGLAAMGFRRSRVTA